MNNRLGKTTLAAVGLVTLLLLLTFGAVELTKINSSLEDPGTTESLNNSDMLWESLTHHLITLAY